MLRRTLLLTDFTLAGICQEPPPAADTQYEFVSGTIADLPPGRIVVNRAVLGKPPENHTFLMTGETKVEGALRVQARVTVGYRTNEDGEQVAMRIIVRPPARAPKN